MNENKTDSATSVRACQNCKLQFEIASDDFDFYEKIKVPPPTFCVDCRNQQRLAARNVKSLYKRPCDKCNKMVISRISPHNPARMYCRECWWSDDWSSTDYGRDYDFTKPFFQQFYELLLAVPHAATLTTNMVDSDYSNMENDSKGCYLTFGGIGNEYSAFCEYALYGKEVYDSYWAFQSEKCLEDIVIERCYRTFYSRECYDCMDTIFSYDCRNCNNIIGCAGLRHASYQIFNKQYTKEEYLKEKAKYDLGSRRSIAELRQKSHAVWSMTPRCYRVANNVIDCSGNDMVNSKNAHNVWQVDGVENVKNQYIAAWSKDSHDETSCAGNELGYMNGNGGGLYNCKFILYALGGDYQNRKHALNCEYSHTIIECSNCFGCVGTRKKQYCILNKQYTKEEYEALLPKVIAHMKEMPFISSVGYMHAYGDFYPAEHSLFAYNECVSNDFYPLSKEAAIQDGFTWREEPASEYTFTDYELPDNIKDVGDDVLQAVLQCAHSGKAYRITASELQFYRTLGLPVPDVAPLQRIKERVGELLPFKLYHRSCMNNCGNEFDTPYAPNRSEIIYCESCYQKTIL